MVLVRCLLVAALVAAAACMSVAPGTLRDSGFQDVQALVAQKVALITSTQLDHDSMLSQPTLGDKLNHMLLAVANEQDDDLRFVGSVLHHMQCHDNLTTVSDDALFARISLLSARVANERARALPSVELQRARRERNVLRDQVHAQFSQCNHVTAGVDEKIKDASDRLAELHFITKTLARGADPATVGHVVAQLGGESTVHTIVERTLLHLLQCNEDGAVDHDGVVSLLEIDMPWWMQEIVGETMNTGKLMMSSGQAKAEQLAVSVESMVESVMTQYRSLVPTLPALSSDAASGSGTLGGATADDVSATAHIQLDAPAAVGESTLEVEVVLVNVSQEALEDGALRSVVHAAAPNVTSTGNDSSLLLSVPTALFGRNLTSTQLTLAVLQATLSDILNAEESNVTSVRALGNDSVAVTVRCSYQGFGLLALAVNDGVLTQRLRLRLASDELVAVSAHVRSKPPPPPPLPTLLSLDEGPTPISECKEGEVCGLHRVGEIFSKMVEGTKQSQDALHVRREKLLQPCSLDLQDLQRRLDVADAKVVELEQAMPNTTASVLALEQAIETLRDAKRSAHKQLENRDSRRQAIFDGLNARQALRDSGVDFADDVARFLGTPVAPEVSQRLEEVTNAKMLLGEHGALLALLQSQLKERRLTCEATLQSLDDDISSVTRNIAVMDEMVDVIQSATTPAHAQSLVALMSTTVADDVEPSLLLGLRAAGSARERLEQAVQSIKASLERTRNDQQTQRKEEKDACDRDMARLKREIAQSSA